MRRARDWCGALVCSAALGCSSGGSGGGLLDGGAGVGGGAGTAGSGGTSGSGGFAGGAGVGGGAGGHTVFGKVAIVNAGSGTTTSVILAAAGFRPDLPSLVPPPGPKAENVVDNWSIPNVPDGAYVVLVAWENDGLTLDPDPVISGSGLTVVEVAGADVDAGSFNVTGALDLVSPDNGQTVTMPPTFVWADDAGEDHYDLQLFDQSGGLVWETSVPAKSNVVDVSADYFGPPLSPGMTYQFRATSINSSQSPIARTENLRGVFVIAP